MATKLKKKLTVKDYNKLATNFGELKDRVDVAEDKAKKYEEKFSSMQNVNIHTNNINSDESKALRSFGCSHVKDLLKVNTCDPKFSYVENHVKGAVLQLKHEFETARIIAQIFHDGKYDRIGTSDKQDSLASVPSITESYYYKNVVAPKLKAFGTGGGDSGSTWIPTAISSSYISEAELAYQVVGALKQINMPTNPYELPSNGFTTARKGTENVSATDSSFSTSVINFNAQKTLEYYIFPEELSEDSAPDIVALGRQELIAAHQRAFETAVINGSVGGMDADIAAGSADLAEKLWNGLRQLAINNSANGAVTDFGNAVVTDANLNLMRQRMGKLGVNPQLAHSLTHQI